MKSVYRILLISHKNVDNLGDQMIRACDIALLDAVMKNLGFERETYEIVDCVAATVRAGYLKTRDPRLLTEAEEAVKSADVLLFGGSPMLNFRYEHFSERTAVFLELAERFHKPVLFSALGVETYDEENPKCQAVKQWLNRADVRQITTRDDLASLQKYCEREDIIIKKVSDPAVYTFKVYEPFCAEKRRTRQKKIGLFVIRGKAFEDNGIDFSQEQMMDFWQALSEELTARGHEYEFLTTSSHADEAFLRLFRVQRKIPVEKCVQTINKLEDLVYHITSYDAVVACRLHPNIISYSLGVPAVGIFWNPKIGFFYEEIGYPERCFRVDELDVKRIADQLELNMKQGVERDETYLISIYDSLFEAFKGLLCPEKHIEPYSYEELLKNIKPADSTTYEELEDKLEDKLLRTYAELNKAEKGLNKAQKSLDAHSCRQKQAKEEIKELKAEIKRLKAENKQLKESSLHGRLSKLKKKLLS